MVLETKLVFDRIKLQPKGCGFVKFSTREEAVAAKDAVHGRIVMPGMRTPIQVDWAGNTGQPTRPPADFRTPEEKAEAIAAEGFNEQSKVYFTHFPTNYDVNDIAAIFTNFGLIRDLQLMRHPDTHRFKGSGSVRFQTRAQAEACIEGVNGQELPGGRKPVEVRWAETAEQRKVRLDSAAAAREANGTSIEYIPPHADRQGPTIRLTPAVDYNRYPNQQVYQGQSSQGGVGPAVRVEQSNSAPHHAAQVHHDQMNRHMTATYRHFNLDPSRAAAAGYAHYGPPHNLSPYSFLGHEHSRNNNNNVGMMSQNQISSHFPPSNPSSGSYSSEPLTVRVEPGYISNPSSSWGSPHGSARDSIKMPPSTQSQFSPTSQASSGRQTSGGNDSSQSSSFSPSSAQSTSSMSPVNSASSNHYVASSANFAAQASHGHSLSSAIYASNGGESGGSAPPSHRGSPRAYAHPSSASDMSSHLQAQAAAAAGNPHHRHLPTSLIPSSETGARLQQQKPPSAVTSLPLAPPLPGVLNNIHRLASSPESPLAQQLLAAQTDRTLAPTSSPTGTGGNSGGAPPGSCIFVHGLPDGFADSNLRALFESHLHDIVGHQGVVASRVVVDKNTGRSRDFGFVTLSSREQATVAIARMNGFKMPHGKALKLEFKSGEDRAPRNAPRVL
jgi:RNA recognition motif-containing protein